MRSGELLNLVGLSLGVVLYAMLLAMVLRSTRAPRARSTLDPLLLLTAILGLLWNVFALIEDELVSMGVAPSPLLTAPGLVALGFLPAVVVHSVLRGEHDGVRALGRRALVAIAYAASTIAALLQCWAMWQGSLQPSAVSMQLLTYSFVALVVPIGVITRDKPRARRLLWVAALTAFAISAFHLSKLHEADTSWPMELLGHHASVPLALAILYQDYPFALADLFAKRVLALLSVVAAAVVALGVVAWLSPTFSRFLSGNASDVGLLVLVIVATSLFYPAISRGSAWVVDRMLLQRPDYNALKAAISRRVVSHDDIATLLTTVCDQLAPALSAPQVQWSVWEPPKHVTDDDLTNLVVLSNSDEIALVRGAARPEAESAVVAHSIAAVLCVPTNERPRYLITIGALAGGRRLLSDDVAFLDAVATVVARRIDAIRTTSERYDREMREQEMSRLATEAELRALRAQVNPHFLFNTLTTIAHLIQTAPPRALHTLLRLTSLLRVALKSEGPSTTLGRELELVAWYLEIEAARFEERLRVTIDVPQSLRAIAVPPFVLQPLVENAIKHGIACKAEGGDVIVRARVQTDADAPSRLSLVVQDTGLGAGPAALARGRDHGVGLRNLEGRLAYLYGSTASLSIESAVETGTTVEILLPIELPATVSQTVREAAL